eukprot:gene928-biopygen996
MERATRPHSETGLKPLVIAPVTPPLCLIPRYLSPDLPQICLGANLLGGTEIDHILHTSPSMTPSQYDTGAAAGLWLGMSDQRPVVGFYGGLLAHGSRERFLRLYSQARTLHISRFRPSPNQLKDYQDAHATSWAHLDGLPSSPAQADRQLQHFTDISLTASLTRKRWKEIQQGIAHAVQEWEKTVSSFTFHGGTPAESLPTSAPVLHNGTLSWDDIAHASRFPLDIAQWLVDLDEAGYTIVRILYALEQSDLAGLEGVRHLSFNPERGTGQGDIHSPFTWLAVFDVLLTIVEQTPSSEHHVLLRHPDKSLYVARDICFADDLQSFGSTLEGLQRTAELVSTYTIVFNLSIASHKLRAFYFRGMASPPTDPPYILVHALAGFLNLST